MLENLRPSWEVYNLTQEQYEDIVKPYKIIIEVLLRNQPGKILAPQEVIDLLKKAESDYLKDHEVHKMD